MSDGRRNGEGDPEGSDCEGCGVCCLQQGSPPGYLWLMSRTPSQQLMWPDQDDVDRLKDLPAAALRILRRYKLDVIAGRNKGDGPCVWLNQQTRRCRFHEHRPQICRDFMVQGEGCATRREEYGLEPLLPVLYEIQ